LSEAEEKDDPAEERAARLDRRFYLDFHGKSLRIVIVTV
jgi:hypothetical protein